MLFTTFTNSQSTSAKSNVLLAPVLPTTMLLASMILAQVLPTTVLLELAPVLLCSNVLEAQATERHANSTVYSGSSKV